MNIRVHGRVSGGFTIAEVSMAVGIVAFGLVAVFSILPFGLTAQKDNREETIIRYEAQYWFAALQSGGLRLEEMNRVKRVELTDANATVPRIITYDPDRFPDWQVNVCRWLSAPDDEVNAKFARVWALNGSLFDRLNTNEFSFNYFMETHVEPIGDSGSRITLTFYWPISGPIEAALDSNSSSINEIVKDRVAGLPPPANEKSFSILTSLRPETIKSDLILNNRQKQFLRAGLPGQKVLISDLEELLITSPDPEEYFKTRKGKQLIINAGDNTTTVEAPGVFSEKEDIEWYKGWYIKINNTGKPDGWKFYRIRKVEKKGNGHVITSNFSENSPNMKGRTRMFPKYWVTFLDENPKDEAWEKLLKEWEEEGLGTVDSGQWTYGFVSPGDDSNSSSWILK